MKFYHSVRDIFIPLVSLLLSISALILFFSSYRDIERVETIIAIPTYDASENDLMVMQARLATIPDVSSVTIIPAESAAEEFNAAYDADIPSEVFRARFSIICPSKDVQDIAQKVEAYQGMETVRADDTIEEENEPVLLSFILLSLVLFNFSCLIKKLPKSPKAGHTLVALLCVFALSTPSFALPYDETTEERLEAYHASNNLAEESIDVMEEILESQLSELSEINENISARQEETEVIRQRTADYKSEFYNQVRKIEETGTSDTLSQQYSISEYLQWGSAVCKEYDFVEENNDNMEKNMELLKIKQLHVIENLQSGLETLQKRIAQNQSMISVLESNSAAISEEALRMKALDERIREQLQNNNGFSSKTSDEIYRILIQETGLDQLYPKGSEIAAFALQFLGERYVWGAESPEDGFDCSGLMYYVFSQFQYRIHRTARPQFAYDGISVAKNDLQPGDMVFFRHLDTTAVEHVGMYIGEGYFIHASNPTDGVKISNLNSEYYQCAYLGGKRVVT